MSYEILKPGIKIKAWCGVILDEETASDLAAEFDTPFMSDALFWKLANLPGEFYRRGPIGDNED